MSEEQVSYFRAVPEEDCHLLLASRPVGRVAWQAPGGIQVMPVNYRYEDGRIVFHTAASSPLSQLANPTPVAFQVDEIDDDAAVGWSVLAHGTTGVHPQGGESRSWVSERRQPIAIVVESVTGRAVSGERG